MKKTGQAHLVFAVLSIFIASITLFYIFGSIGKMSEDCKVQVTEICQQLSGPSMTMLFILLIIAGFAMIISTVVYILISTQAI